MANRRPVFVGAAILLGVAAFVLLVSGPSRREGDPPATGAARERPPSPPAALDPGDDPPSPAELEAARVRRQSGAGTAPAPRAAPRNEPVYRGTWGSGPGQLGNQRNPESNAEGPPTITPGRDGSALVLDAVNGRLQRLGPDGSDRGTVRLSQMLPQDVRELPDGSLLVLDRLADRSVMLLGPDGAPRGELPLVGKGVPASGGVTGLIVDGDSVYAEVEHGRLVRLGDTSGRADPERPELEGRPTGDGRLLLTAGIVDAPSGRLFLAARDRATLEHRFTRELQAGEPVTAILSLDSDPQGAIYLGLAAGAEGNERTRVLCLAPDGSLRGGVELPPSTGPEETFRPVSVDEQGNIWVLVIGEAGPEIHRARCGSI